ncbi:hypothetical protein Avbf_04397 [Armadillidium vulgare]|nr:hypothetical protein Avbf_04397 [Armadillidium vulgare]
MFYKAGTVNEINATVGMKLGLRSVNITLFGKHSFIASIVINIGKHSFMASIVINIANDHQDHNCEECQLTVKCSPEFADIDAF